MARALLFFSCRLYAYEVEKSCEMNENLGAGIAVFQGLSNVALNCEPEQREHSQTYNRACGIALFRHLFPFSTNRHRPWHYFRWRDFDQQQWNVGRGSHVFPRRLTDCSEVKHTTGSSIVDLFLTFRNVCILLVANWSSTYLLVAQVFSQHLHPVWTSECWTQSKRIKWFLCIRLVQVLYLLQMVRGISSGARVFEYLSLKPTIRISGGGRIPYHSLTGRVDLMDISFRFLPQKANMLSRLYAILNISWLSAINFLYVLQLPNQTWTSGPEEFQPNAASV